MANKDIQIRDGRSLGNVGGMGRQSQDLEQVFDHFLSDPFGTWMSELPTISRNALGSIKETDNAYLLAADIPGIPKEDVKIHVDGNLLTVSAENDRSEGDEDSSVYRREYHSFQQSFTLPSNVDADKIEAHCENGVLEILMPKMADSSKKQVEVQSGKGGLWNKIKDEFKKH